ncbi:MAG: hypothetical protein ACLSVD_13600 [Eggerthellaceae bacterium]
MASFAIEPAFWELFPRRRSASWCSGIDNAHESSQDVKAALVEANKAALAHVPDPTISKNPAGRCGARRSSSSRRRRARARPSRRF